MLPFWPRRNPRCIRKPSFTMLTLFTLACGTAAAVYGILLEPRLLETVRIKISCRGLPLPLGGLKIAHISDLHVGSFMSRERVRAAVDEVLSLDPDMIALTGDFVERFTSSDGQVLENELLRLTAPLGVYAVLGNHDHWADPDDVVSALEKAGVIVLRNSSAVVERGGKRLYIVGLDDAQEGRADLSAAMMTVPSDGCAVLLVHEPDVAVEAAKDERIFLQLAGHSHGGQICVPGVPASLPKLAHFYPQGLYHVGSLWLYTSRGIGTTVLPIRLNCRPEITLLELSHR